MKFTKKFAKSAVALSLLILASALCACGQEKPPGPEFMTNGGYERFSDPVRAFRPAGFYYIDGQRVDPDEEFNFR